MSQTLLLIVAKSRDPNVVCAFYFSPFFLVLTTPLPPESCHSPSPKEFVLDMLYWLSLIQIKLLDGPP